MSSMDHAKSRFLKPGTPFKAKYDYIVCGSGSSGSVVARRLAENADASVLLLEAGGAEDVDAVMTAAQWPTNLGSERRWCYRSELNPHLNNRAMPIDAGKVLGRGSSINVMTWHKVILKIGISSRLSLERGLGRGVNSEALS
jgi:choline dehydrogenase